MESAGTPTPRKLTRPRGGRVLAGVCAGLGRHLGIDPVVVRVLAVVLVLLGGAGLLAYAALWLLVPEEPVGSEDATAVQGSDRQLTAGAIVLIAVLLVVGSPFILGGGFVLLGLAIPLAIAGLTGLVVWWLVSGEPFSGSPGYTLKAAVLGLLVLTACFLLLGAGFFGTGLGGGAATGGAVIAAGVVLVIGAFAGRVRWVALPAVALALGSGVAAASQVDLTGGVGDREYRPTTDLRSEYEIGMGQLVVDLRAAKLRRGDTPLKLRAGMGHVVLVVPRDVCVATRAKLGAGGIDLFERVSGGFDYDFSDEPPARRRGKRVVVDADIGFGQLTVSHDASILEPYAARRRGVDPSPPTPGQRNGGCARA